jgi:L-ascorbate metabolism protein UlaG (beta-lactamase superfamily)
MTRKMRCARGGFFLTFRTVASQFRKSRQKLAEAGKERNRRRAEVVAAAVNAELHAPGAPTHATRVGIGLENGWNKRNFLVEVLLPSLLQKRAGQPNPTPFFPALANGQIGITWIGHASFLVQMAGLNILIDPNWSLWLKGIKRLRTPGLQLHELPMIDLVLVTHAHFDHLDRRTLRAVAANQPIVVPFGVGNLVHDLGFERVHELNYWDVFQHGEISITLTPCHHWGARVLHDQHRGFGGFALAAGGRSVFHCGDTAYFDGFKEIGKRCPAEIALLPIGAYDTPSGRAVHMNPEEAVQAFLELGARTLVPMHYGTFRLSYEPMAEPPQRLLARAREAGVESQVHLMEEGQPGVF